VIDYRQEDPIEVVCREAAGGGVDLILDTVGGDTIERSPYGLRPGGRIVSIVDIPQPQSLLEAWNRNAELHFVFTPPRRATLEGLRVLLESGAVRPLIDSVLPLEQAPAALARLEAGGVRGKIALAPPSVGSDGVSPAR
jgi:NADPH:quinone reductase-like Zn-dependent oxidoreductase